MVGSSDASSSIPKNRSSIVVGRANALIIRKQKGCDIQVSLMRFFFSLIFRRIQSPSLRLDVFQIYLFFVWTYFIFIYFSFGRMFWFKFSSQSSREQEKCIFFSYFKEWRLLSSPFANVGSGRKVSDLHA